MVGWTTEILSNQILSDLVPGFSLSVEHDLWDGPAGLRSSRFDPFLQGVTANFSVTGNTFRSLGALFGLGGREGNRQSREPDPQQQPRAGGMPMPGDIRRASLLTPSQPLSRGSQPFQATVGFSYSRSREAEQPGVSNINLRTGFSPTQFWSLSWETAYNSERGAFEYHNLSLARDLHEWRASFNFTKSPNGNFIFFVSVFLMDLPDLKFDYNQATIAP
jgi:hypothetical protein